MINRDQATSVPNRDFELEEKLHEVIYKKYLQTFTNQLDRMETVPDFVRDDTYHGISSGHHRAYKLKVGDNEETFLESSDGTRRYEFLIEFDFDDASYGIYYGCRGLIMDGDQKGQIQLFDQEWLSLRNEICLVLNNTFTDIDFSGRFQLTNNANNKTYWPFWIALYAGEDIIDVAARATRLIANVYKHFQHSSNPSSQITEAKKLKTTIPRFTREKYRAITIDILNISGGKGEETREEIASAFENFFCACEKLNILEPDDRYEKAWRVKKGIKNVMIAVLIKKYCEKYHIKKNGTPWAYFEDLILSDKGTLLDDMKKAVAQSKDDHLAWAEKILYDIDNIN